MLKQTAPLAFVALAALLLAVPASAQSTAPAQTGAGRLSFRALVANGFVVVSTSFIPAEARVTAKSPVMVVTLLNAGSVAVCTFAEGAWENLSTAAQANDPNLCDVFRAR